MTNLDLTRPRSACTHSGVRDRGDLIGGGDPCECPACLAVGSECEFHQGWAAGWDACSAFVAQVVEDKRTSELAGDLGDVEGVV